MRYQLQVMLGVSALALSSPEAVKAQTQSGAAPVVSSPRAQETSGESPFALSEIIVTARRRAENIQNVPVAISALTPAMLKAEQFESTADLQTVVPGLTINQGGGGNRTNITLRGLGRLPLGDANPGSVAMYFADVPLQSEAQIAPTYDISGIQVLKGPQGTLFGRNTTGGAILISPQEPTYTNNGYIQVEAGNYNYYTAEGAINIPLVDDKLALRVSGQVRRRDGYVQNLGVGPDVDDINDESARVQLLFQPTSRISNLAIFDYFEDGGAGAVGQLYTLNPAGLATEFAAPLFYCHIATPANPVPCTGFHPTSSPQDPFGDLGDALAFQNSHHGGRSIATNVAPSEFRRVFGVINRTTVDLGDGITLKNIFGFRDSNAVATVPGPFNFFLPLYNAYTATSGLQFTDELQLQGQLFDDRIHYTVGDFYLATKPNKADYIRSDLFGAVGTYGNTFSRSSSEAIYGQIDVKLDELLKGLSFTAGVRQTWDSLTTCSSTTAAAPQQPAACANYAGGAGLPSSSTVTVSSSAPTWTFSLNYQPTRDLLLYFTSRRGYRQGGVNTPLFNTPATDENPNPTCAQFPVGTPAALANLCRDLRSFQTFKPEFVTDYEIGLKSTWHAASWSGLFDIDAYDTSYSQIQETAVLTPVLLPGDPGAPPFGAVLYNGGSQKLRGVEATAVVSPFADLRLTANVAYFNSTAPTISIIDIPNPPPNQAVPGQTTWTYSLDGSYVFPFHPGGADLSFDINWYHAPANKLVIGLPIPGYDLVDMKLGVENVANTGLDAAIFVRNLTDTTYVVNTAVAAPAFGFTTAVYGEPRVFGLQLSYKFGQGHGG